MLTLNIALLGTDALLIALMAQGEEVITLPPVLRFVDKHHHGSVPASHQAGCYSKL
ncbi:MAG: hypothetical protein ABFS56_17345 [Pseudomonadota bacterium]